MMGQVTTEAPSKERPVQQNHSVPQASPQEVLVLETLRQALCAANIEHDDWDYIAHKCLDGLKAHGLVPAAVDFRSVIRAIDPHARVVTEYTVHTPCFYEEDNPRTKAQAEEMVAAIIAHVSGPSRIEPSASGSTLRVVAGPWQRGGSLEFWVHYSPEDSHPAATPDARRPAAEEED